MYVMKALYWWFLVYDTKVIRIDGDDVICTDNYTICAFPVSGWREQERAFLRKYAVNR